MFVAAGDGKHTGKCGTLPDAVCQRCLDMRRGVCTSSSDMRGARAGRVASKRRMGKLVFYDIKADGEKVQAMAAADNSPLDEPGFVTLHNRRAPCLNCVVSGPGTRTSGAFGVSASKSGWQFLAHVMKNTPHALAD